MAAYAQTCVFSISPSSNRVGAEGGSFGPVQILAAGTNCQRTVTSTVPWMTVTYGATGAGSGTFGYAVERNLTAQQRTGVINAAGQTFTVTQAAANCTFTLTPVSASMAAAGGTGTIGVRTSCSWTAESDSPWITIAGGGSGAGEGTVTYVVQANAGAPRSGVIRIGTQSFAVSQGGRECPTSISPVETDVPAAGVTGTITVTAEAGCSWSATTSVTWITLAGSSGSGSGAVRYTVAANTEPQARTSGISIGAKRFNVRQAAAACNFVIAPEQANVAASGGRGRVMVTAASGCTWSASSNVSWLSVEISGTSFADYVAAPNPGPETRTGTLLIAGRTFTVTQFGGGARPVLSAAANAANYARAAVSPGEIVTLFGSAIGPAILKTAELTPDGERLTTFLAQTRVFFDEIAAALVYTSEAQVSAIVPYAVAGRPVTQITVEHQGVRSNALSMPVAAAVPGVFTIDGSGSGPGAVLNQDFTVNSDMNPAPAGSIVQIFATGEGATDPPGMDGKLAKGELPKPRLPVTVTIGGIEARVHYAGAAPGLVAGVLQVNAEVPEGVEAGAAAQVVVRVGESASQTGVTIAVSR
jgi:uncharacterized protein (TIGR03437 family)